LTNQLSKQQILDSSIVEEDELLSAGESSLTPILSSVNISSITSATKTIIGVSSDFLYNRFQSGDIIKILSGPAIGSYTIQDVIDDETIVVNEAILDSGTTTSDLYFKAGALIVGFDPARLGPTIFTKKTLQEALEELGYLTTTYASPGFTWGRSGAIPAGTWLQNDTVPSNITGRHVFLTSAKIKKIFIANENINTFNLEIYEHDGTTYTLLTTVTVTSLRKVSFALDVSVTFNKEIAIKVSSGSCKNIVCGLIITGII